MKKKLKSLGPSDATACSLSSDTPETDAVMQSLHPMCRFPRVAEKLAEMERERNKWKANHDNQVALKRIITDRPDMGDRAKRVDELITAGREIIEAARRSLPRPHPTIERNAKFFIPANAEVSDAAKNATAYYIRPYGIYHRGEVYWDADLPRKKGTVVKFFGDASGPCLSLVVFDIEGNYLTTAWPVSWEENDHPAQHELAAWWETLSDDERKEMTADE